MKTYLTLLLFLALTFASSAQEWNVPAERNSRLSTFLFDNQTMEKGLSIYKLNCKLCHGDPGKANFQKLNPLPGDPASDKFQHNSDGALQFKISEGRGLMPSFKKVLVADDIWVLISYIRSLKPDYIQEIDQREKLSNVPWSEINIKMSHDAEQNMLKVLVTGLEKEDWTAVPSSEIIISVKRYFGELTIDEPKYSDKYGKAEFILPDNLPGDKEGNIVLTARLSDSDLFGEILSESSFKIGLETDIPSLTDKRAMWNTNRMAPIWLLVVFPGVVLTVWALIFFVLFQIRKIYRLGEKE